MVETTGNAHVDIAADPDEVYAILSDLSRISELSPECYKAEWEGDSTGPIVGATSAATTETTVGNGTQAVWS